MKLLVGIAVVALFLITFATLTYVERLLVQGCKERCPVQTTSVVYDHWSDKCECVLTNQTKPQEPACNEK